MNTQVAICIPARDTCDMMFAHDLANLCVKSVMDGISTAMAISQGTLLASQRHALVIEARRMDATHVLWLDTDMRFPPDTLTRLLSRNQHVVGANCAKRRMPTGPTAANYDKSGKKVPVFTEPHSTGLEAVDALGTGILLVSMEVYDSIPAPWFQTPWIPEHNNYQGEDIFFARVLRQYGVPIHVDHDLSKEIGHIGQWEYQHAHTWAVREQKAAEEAAAEKPFALAVEA